MISVGDAVCTTTPLAGRGRDGGAGPGADSRVGHHGTDIDSATMRFDQWCTENIVAAATESGDVALRTAVEPYSRMDALPASLDAVEPTAREIFAAGW
jgi:hypothetical protein